MCERFKQWPGDYHGLPEDDKWLLLGYERVRMEEESMLEKNRFMTLAEIIAAMFGGKKK